MASIQTLLVKSLTVVPIDVQSHLRVFFISGDFDALGSRILIRRYILKGKYINSNKAYMGEAQM